MVDQDIVAEAREAIRSRLRMGSKVVHGTEPCTCGHGEFVIEPSCGFKLLSAFAHLYPARCAKCKAAVLYTRIEAVPDNGEELHPTNFRMLDIDSDG
jgi:hypothetical protein